MSRSARRTRWQFTGWIAGLGTASGHRIVIGHWPTSPYGAATDAMVEDPTGHRTLYAPTPELAEFLSAAYRFHDVQVATCSARRSGSCWTVQASPLQLSFAIGRRTLLGWLLWAVPPRWPERHGGWPCWTFPPTGCCQGSAPVAAPATAVASGTAPRICTRSLPPTPRSLAVIWARCERSTRRSALALAPCRRGHPWSVSPR
jgi:hypothetical protein